MANVRSFLISADYVGSGDFYTADQVSDEYLFIGKVMQHSTNGRVLLATNQDPYVNLWANTIVSSGGTTTIHYANAARDGTVLVEGTLRNSHNEGVALRIWGANSRTEVYERGSIYASGAAGTAIDLSVQSLNTKATIKNAGLIEGNIGINRSGSENVEIINSGVIFGDSRSYRALFGGVDVIYNTGRMSGQIDFGGGNDVYIGHGGYLTGSIYAGTGNDVLRAGDSAAAFFWGEDGDDELTGGVFGDRLYAGAGNDFVWGGGGEDIIEGWSGNDTLYGDAGHDVFYGNTGNDKLMGGTGDDVLWGQEDNDQLYGDAGIDTMIGGTGNDKFYVDRAQDIVVENAGEGSDQIFASSSYRLAAGVEVEALTATTGTAAVRLYGNDLAQAVQGNDGANYVYGQGGSDTVSGRGGADFVFGGLGNDRLFGGAGNDVFVFNTALNAATNRDSISDFGSVAGDDDTIHLENAVFRALTTRGALDVGLFRASANGQAADADDFILYNTSNGVLSYDSNGNAAGGVVQFAIVSGHPTLTAADFFVI